MVQNKKSAPTSAEHKQYFLSEFICSLLLDLKDAETVSLCRGSV